MRPSPAAAPGPDSDPGGRTREAGAACRAPAGMQSEYQVQCCVVENLRNLSRMLMCLDRVGKELFLEVSDRHVSLRTLNQAQSAFVTFTLKETFFSDFIVEDDVTASVKLHLKNMVSVFRSVQHVDKLWLQLACQGTEQYMRVQHESWRVRQFALVRSSPATHWASVQSKAGETVWKTPFGNKTV